jgi:N-hydroxyarylamine O-acetyltransferase
LGKLVASLKSWPSRLRSGSQSDLEELDLNSKAYLERIKYGGSLNPNAKTLRDLQLTHLMTVPFENLSIHQGEPIILEDTALFEKIVKRRRGGFCYELNGLFAALLRSLGFNVSMLSARVAEGNGRFSPDFDHMTLMVSLADRWLADVGFGDTFREPLRLEAGTVQTQFGRDYRLDSDGDLWTLMESEDGAAWRAEYQFDLQAYQYDDFLEMCHYHQTSPESHFTQKRICTRATPTGRLTLSENRFITTTLSGQRRERELASEDEIEQILRERFNIIVAA